MDSSKIKDPQEVPSTIGFAVVVEVWKRLYTVVEPQVGGHQHLTNQSWSNVHTLWCLSTVQLSKCGELADPVGKEKHRRHHQRCAPDSVQKLHRKCARFEAKTLADEDLRHFLALLAGKSWQEGSVRIHWDFTRGGFRKMGATPSHHPSWIFHEINIFYNHPAIGLLGYPPDELETPIFQHQNWRSNCETSQGLEPTPASLKASSKVRAAFLRISLEALLGKIEIQHFQKLRTKKRNPTLPKVEKF